jgi:cytochrome c oxidase cbb3-type subunit 2
MNRLPLIFLGIFLTFLSAWIGLVAYPYVNLGKLGPEVDEESGDLVPPPLSGSAIAGQRVYASAGCVYCHSQQIRPAYLSTDIQKGLGVRRTVARDYIREQPAFLGTMRTGPDLTNIGVRYPDANWHHQHLYEPMTVTPGSIMPSFRYLYRLRPISGQQSANAVQGLRGPHAPPPGFEVVPSEDAVNLVAYLVSLKRNYPLPEAPEETIE